MMGDDGTWQVLHGLFRATVALKQKDLDSAAGWSVQSARTLQVVNPAHAASPPVLATALYVSEILRRTGSHDLPSFEAARAILAHNIAVRG